ncbi:hypothetical protein JAO29_03930 [Edaphobacter sp. HDX4]|uniref:hypothetical protein n=1 Tax=Edaphobacter sp. HDX4 TaxID=2794064 RepID=UPI002FE53CD2
MTDTSSRAVARALPWPIGKPAVEIVDHIQQGAFQRSMSLLVAGTSVISGMEVAYEHYKGSYSNPVMYTPVVLSGALAISGLAAFLSRRAAQTILRYVSYATLVDGVIGFGFHIRGVARKPGGWRLPITNIVMGPPIFAPLLFGTSAYLGVITSYLRREEDYGLLGSIEASAAAGLVNDFREDIRTGHFQKHLCIVAAISTLCSGAESWYSHYKDNFKFRVQWSPILLTPLMLFATLSSVRSRRIANTLLPVASGLLMANGIVGTGYHIRGILRRPGGRKKPLYNILYGPPIFAPMLMAAAGMLGALAYLMGREKHA